MGTITTTMTTQMKVDFFKAWHCFLAAQSSLAGAGVNGAFTITGLASTALLAVGMAASGTNVAAGAIVASIDSGTQVTVSKAHTGTVTTGTIGFTADVFKIALIKFGPAGTYGAASVNYSDITGNSDEPANSGTYAAGGFTLVNVNPSNPSGTTAITSFNTNPSWTSATLDTAGAMIYNTSQRGATANRAVSLHDFGGEQKVTAGTLTLNLPVADASNAILRIA